MNSKLKIHNVKVEKSFYEQNINYEEKESSHPSLDFDIEFLLNKSNDSLGIVKLSCGINTNENFEEVPFYMEVTILGQFEVENEGKFEEYLLNSVSILFPYIRAHINTVTAISGIQPFLIPSINIVELLQAKVTKEQDNEETD